MTNNSETMSILFFWSGSLSEPLGFCCQWYRSEFQSEDGKSFNCAEQYMMWRKASLFGDYDTAKAILGTTSAKKQKQLGRQVKGFDGEKWDQRMSFQILSKAAHHYAEHALNTFPNMLRSAHT